MATAELAPKSAVSRSRRMRRLRENATGYLFIAPWIIGLVVFTGGPIFGGLALSLFDWDTLSAPEFIGFDNFTRLPTDERFVRSLHQTVYFTFASVPLGLTISFLLALLVNQKLKGVNFFRTAYFLPGVSSVVAIALIWGWLYDGHTGLVNFLLDLIPGVTPPLWLVDTRWSMPAVIIMSVWRTMGFDMIIFLAGLQAIAPEYYESARIDGANRWQLLRHITLPLISFTIFFLVVVSIIGSFKVFEQTLILTNGGPAFSTYTLVFYIYRHAFQQFNMGYASAMAFTLFAITFIVTMFQWRMQRRWVHYD